MKALRMTEEELREYVARTKKIVVTDKKVIAPDRIPLPRMSKLELRLEQQIEDAGLPKARRNHFPILGRDFEIDFAWPESMMGVEVQGMAHRIKGKFRADIEKRALCLLAGWHILEVGGAEIRSGKAIQWITQLLGDGHYDPS